MRVHRPHQCETELQHLDRPPEPGVIPESAPRQPHPLERVVEDDSVVLGHEQRVSAHCPESRTNSAMASAERSRDDDLTTTSEPSP